MVEISDSSDDECCHYEGGITYVSSSENDSSPPGSIANSDQSEWEDASELEGDALLESVDRSVAAAEDEEAALRSAFDAIMEPKTQRDWKKAEAKRAGGYTGRSERTERLHRQQAREKEEKDALLRSRYDWCCKPLCCSFC